MHKLLLPRLGQTMEEALLVGWLVPPGQDFEAGTPLYEVETEKVTTAVEATVPGRLVRVLVDPEERVEVGAVLAVIAGVGEVVTDVDVDDLLQGSSTSTAPVAVLEADAPAPSAATGPVEAVEPVEAPRGPVRAMPRTRALARSLGVELGTVRGTGPDGLVLESDLVPAAVTELAPETGTASAAPAAPAAPVPAAVEQVSVPTTRDAVPAAQDALPGVDVRERRRQSRVARRMAEVVARSWSAVPQFSQSVTVDATTWRGRRDRLREETGEQIGYTEMLLAALVRAVHEVPEVNASLAGDELVVYRDVNVSIAVDTPSGLQVPVLHKLQELTTAGISRRLKDVAERARADRLTVEDVSGGTITLSNLGMYGIEDGFPMVTAPQSCIVFAGAVTDRVVAVGDTIGVRPTMTLVSAFDHRALDGATAARFTSALRRFLQESR
ncbi:MAG: dihydrolipoamide acetyltransferase family protein [Candidatus Nanopelagicales bacterium]